MEKEKEVLLHDKVDQLGHVEELLMVKTKSERELVNRDEELRKINSVMSKS